jgi:hypothetical protein
MGVAPVYLEPIIEQMIKTNLLIANAKKRYCTNFCVFPNQTYTNAEAISCLEFRNHRYCEKISKILYNLKEKITQLDFFGNDLPYEYLMWILYVVAGEQIGIIANEKYLEKYKEKYEDEGEREYRITMQYAGADEKIDFSMRDNIKKNEWSSLHQNFKRTRYGDLQYVNDYAWHPFPMEEETFKKGRDLWIDGNNISLLIALSENSNMELNPYEEEMVAEFIKNGLVENTNAGLKVLIPIFKEEIFREIVNIVKAEVYDYAVEYSDIIASQVEKLLLPYVREDLMSNFIYWDMQMFFQPVSYLFYYGMYESNCLEIPKDYGRSAAGLYILRK